MYKYSFILVFFVYLLTETNESFSQTTLKGTIKGAGGTLPGTSIFVDQSAKAILSNKDGSYLIVLNKGWHSITFSYSGYTERKDTIWANGSDTTIVQDIELFPQRQELETVLIVGSRSHLRSSLKSALPIDVLSAGYLQSTGQPSLDKQMQYRVPSFNSINVPVRDATTFFDPYELRNMGPSRTLILINGKRKNPTSLLYVQFAPGRGETGVDISTIPIDAIKQVEILRDGASAQYGSDAIAGVINIKLKDKYEYSSLSINAGITSKGDGASYGFSFNGGSSFQKNGFINYTIDVSQQNNAVRSGIINRAVEKLFFGGSREKDSLIDAFLDRFPTGRNINGTGNNSAAKFNINFGISTGEQSRLYGNAGLVSRKSLSYANYRTPYWRTDAGLLHTRIPGAPNYTGNPDPLYEGYLGYVPTFEGDLLDYHFTLGFKSEINKWTHDISFTTGGNSQLYTVENTVNKSLGTLSPTFFKPGGFGFSHLVGNYDISRELTSDLSIAFGAEVRSENYEVIAGDTASYYGEGANSFPGMRAENASSNQRFNMGAYGDITYQPSSSLLVNAAVRAERYSDFGEAFVWKLSGRKNFFAEKLILRTSLSTGFRAPTLHQIYTQSTVLSYVSNNIESTGLFNNRSKQAFLLGVPRLKAEKSFNFSTGLGVRLNGGWEMTFDYYSIRLTDRIFYSSGISATSPNTPLGMVLKNAGVVQAQFFLNGLESLNNGFDFVINYKAPSYQKHKLGFSMAGNMQLRNEIIGTPNDPPLISSEGQSTLSPAIHMLLTQSRPKYKVIAGFDYTFKQLNLLLSNTLFGPTTYQDIDGGGPEMKNIQQVFLPAVVTDLNVRYKISSKITFAFSVNNLFNILPQWKLVPINNIGEQYLKSKDNQEFLRGLLSFAGRYHILGASGSQFSQLGTTFQSSLVFKF